MSPTVTRAEVIDQQNAKTRIPTEEEMRAIASYVDRYTHDVGSAPIADHEVEGVGLVLFMRDPTNPLL